MWAYGMYGNCKFPKKHQNGKGGYNFSISLGMNKGFAQVQYYYNGGPIVNLSDGAAIHIPKGDIKIQNYITKEGIEKTTLIIVTNYLEIVLTQEERKTQEYKEKVENLSVSREDASMDNIATFETKLKNKKVEEDDEPWELDL